MQCAAHAPAAAVAGTLSVPPVGDLPAFLPTCAAGMQIDDVIKPSEYE